MIEGLDDRTVREVFPYLKFLRNVEDDETLENRIFHLLYDYDTAAFESLLGRLDAVDASGGVSFLARDLDEQAETVRAVEKAGHEVVFHGYRHTSFMEASYDVAYADLSDGLDRFDEATGITPEGLHIPFMRCSGGTLRAAAELGFEWVMGRTDAAAPDGLTLLEPVSPYDFDLLERGNTPRETFEELGRQATEGSVFLHHPNIHERHNATAAFDEWLETYRPVSPGEVVAGADGVAAVLDCIPPFRIE